MQDAIQKLEEIKRQREAAQKAQEAAPVTPKRRGRPPKVREEDPASASGLTGSGDPPVKRSRQVATGPDTPTPVTLSSSPEQPGFGVSRPTAHRPLGLLEVQDSADLDALMADPRLSEQIAMRLDERFALVLPAALERLQAALLKGGHTPKRQSRNQG